MNSAATLSVLAGTPCCGQFAKLKKRKNRFSVNSPNSLYTIFCESTVICNHVPLACHIPRPILPLFLLCLCLCIQCLLMTTTYGNLILLYYLMKELYYFPNAQAIMTDYHQLLKALFLYVCFLTFSRDFPRAYFSIIFDQSESRFAISPEDFQNGAGLWHIPCKFKESRPQ